MRRLSGKEQGLIGNMENYKKEILALTETKGISTTVLSNEIY